MVTNIQGGTGLSTAEKNTLINLLEIMEELNYLPGQNNLMTLLDYGKRKSMVNITDGEFKDYLKYESLQRFGSIAKDKDIRDAISICRHNYKIEHDTNVEMAVRVYYDKKNKRLYYDLANNDMEYVVIDEKKGITIEKMDFDEDKDFIFIRSDTAKAQVKPIRPKGNPLKGLDYLDDYLNLPDKAKFLYKIWLITSLNPEIRTPIPYFIGKAGTGKSSMITILNDFIDPSTSPLSNWDSSTNRDLAIAFKYRWNYNANNISKITQKLSDLLCQTYKTIRKGGIL